MDSWLEPCRTQPTFVNLLKMQFGNLPLNAGTRKEMLSKHPNPEEPNPESLMTEMPLDAHPVLFSGLDGEMIKRCALRTNGGAGISQQDDKLWHKMVAAFKETSSDLCNAIARLSRRISTEMVDPNGLAALLANRGIAIDKNPGLRPVWGNAAPHYWKSDYGSDW